jgi:hypothetical protein
MWIPIPWPIEVHHHWGYGRWKVLPFAAIHGPVTRYRPRDGYGLGRFRVWFKGEAERRGRSKGQNDGLVELVVPFPSFSSFLATWVENCRDSCRWTKHEGTLLALMMGTRTSRTICQCPTWDDLNQPSTAWTSSPACNCGTRRSSTTLLRWGRENPRTRRTTRSNKKKRHAKVEQ